MKKSVLLYFLVFLASHAAAQDADPLSVTLPSGKALHFQTAEQKAKFLAARERASASVSPQSPTPAPSQAATPSPPSAGNTSSTGKVNVTAPTFTADYYMFAPETWENKQVTVSVSHMRRSEGGARADGMVELQAHTMNTLTANGDQRSGGIMEVVATPAAAQRLLTLAGTSMQYGGWSYKTTVFKGTFKRSTVGGKGWFVYVDK